MTSSRLLTVGMVLVAIVVVVLVLLLPQAVHQAVPV